MKIVLSLTGLWKHQDKDGNPYLAGNLTPTVSIMIFPNKFKKEGSNQPDYRVTLAERRKREEAPIKEAAPEEFPYGEEEQT